MAWYVVDENNNRKEALDKEGVEALLAEAIKEGKLPSIDEDTAFVTKLKCCVSGETNQVGFVTQAKYNEMSEAGLLKPNTYYHIIDDTTADDLEADWEKASALIADHEARLQSQGESISSIKKNMEYKADADDVYLVKYKGSYDSVVYFAKAIHGEANGIFKGTMPTSPLGEEKEWTALVVTPVGEQFLAIIAEDSFPKDNPSDVEPSLYLSYGTGNGNLYCEKLPRIGDVNAKSDKPVVIGVSSNASNAISKAGYYVGNIVVNASGNVYSFGLSLNSLSQKTAHCVYMGGLYCEVYYDPSTKKIKTDMSDFTMTDVRLVASY